MKVDTIIDALSSLRRQKGENFEVIILDPSMDQSAIASNWTPDFMPITQPYQHDDGRIEMICMLIPNPDRATTADEHGNQRPVLEVFNG